MKAVLAAMGMRLGVLLAMAGTPLVAWSMGGMPAIGAMTSNHSAGYTQTQFPIVLVHGLFGFDTMGSVDYFYGVPKALRDGGATVYVAKVSAANRSEVRGEQLLAELKRLRAVHGHAKFNLVGHSHGSQTVRYVAAVAPELVASVLLVGGPNQGTVVADVVAKALDQSGSTAEVAKIFNMLGSLIDRMGGGATSPQNAEAAMRSLSTSGAQAFNRRFGQGAPTQPCGSGPSQVNGVRYYSATGTGVITNWLDADAALLLSAAWFGGQANDGLVSRCSARWGEVLRDDYPWNHGDEINQSFGLRAPGSPDPVAFYRTHANRLKLAGL